jgi:hypothetical protein
MYLVAARGCLYKLAARCEMRGDGRMDLDVIDYIVEYENGSMFRMSIARRSILRSDDAVALIAAEKQLNGEIPKGKIVRVVRAP